MSEDIQELQKEWRAIVLTRLEALSIQLETIKQELTLMKINSVRLEDFKKLESDVEDLKALKNKMIAAWAAIQVVSVILAWVISNILSK